MNKNKLAALLSLLDDPDQEIYRSIEKELAELPISTIPQLEDSWFDSKNETYQERLESVINKIQFTNIKKNLIKWGASESPNLIDGAILINQSYNPNLLTDPIRKSVQKIKYDVSLEINDQHTALDKIKILNHFFYNIHNYHPLPPNQPTNWDGDIGTVLSQKNGNYIILAIIYAGIAQELNIPVYGINLPGSVLLCYKNEQHPESKRKPSDSILFYINPIDKGTVFGQKELTQIISTKNVENNSKYYLPTSNNSLIKRLVQHEISVYKKLKLDSFIPNFRELYKSL